MKETKPDLAPAEALSLQISKIIHETRNALAAIRARAQLGTFVAKEQPRYNEMFYEIMSNVDRANKIIDKLTKVKEILEKQNPTQK